MAAVTSRRTGRVLDQRQAVDMLTLHTWRSKLGVQWKTKAIPGLDAEFTIFWQDKHPKKTQIPLHFEFRYTRFQ